MSPSQRQNTKGKASGDPNNICKFPDDWMERFKASFPSPRPFGPPSPPNLDDFEHPVLRKIAEANYRDKVLVYENALQRQSPQTAKPETRVRDASLTASSSNAPRKRPATYLPLLPEHVLDDIARDLNEKSLWALMATCRSLRCAAEVALMPHLKRREIRPDPPLSADIFKPIDLVDLGEKDKERQASLRRADRAYTTLANAYPPSAKLLRELTVEVRSDDKEASWDLISRFSSQLQILHLHVVDQRWRVSAKDDDGGSNDEELDDPLDVGNAWPSRLFRPPVINFRDLTTLTITSTARAYAHFARLAPYLPILRDLTLSAHEQDSAALPFERYNIAPLPRLRKLERLTVSGNDRNVATILHGILQRSHDIDSLIVHISNIPPFVNMTMLSIVNDIIDCGRLRQLALYGAMAAGILPMLVQIDHGNEEDGDFMPDLEDLVLEFDRKMPILYSRPDIPNLRYLTFVDKRANVDGDVVHRSAKLALIDYCDESDLRAVFDYYPALERVQWLIGYPSNPFGKIPKWPRRSKACYVDRPAGRDPLRVCRPALQSKT